MIFLKKVGLELENEKKIVPLFQGGATKKLAVSRTSITVPFATSLKR